MNISEATTYDLAIQFIQENPSLNEAQLRQLLSQMSVNVQGSTSTLLYSGVLDTVNQDGVMAWQVAEKLGSEHCSREGFGVNASWCVILLDSAIRVFGE